jgi:LmbE family N-acetylglucosaminyl deacetylase
VDGKLEGQMGSDAMDGQAVDDIVAREDARMPRRRGDDAHVIAVRRLASREGTHLRLDATRPRGVAVTDVGDPHSRRPYATMRPMSRTPRTLVFVHAHPDDEALLTAGTMARATSEGHRVVLVVATDGAAGLTSQQFQDDLARTRQAEVEASARALGVARTVSLGYPDSGLHGDVPGGFAQVGRFTIAKRIAAICDEEGADVLVGYDPSGGYGHPDHIQVHRSVRTATALCTRVPRLFEATLPREPIARAAHLAATLRLTPAEFSPAEFDAAWTPRADITHRVDVRSHLAAKDASLRAHSSQAAADGTTRTLAVLTRLPQALQALLLGTEYYVAVPASHAARTSSTAVGLS